MTAYESQQTALDYLHRRWSVIPMRRRDKRPAIRWQNFQTALASEEQLRDWFQRWPDSNVGIVTGAVSGLVVLDVDPQHGGEQSLKNLERRHGPLPRTVEAITGGGGRHVYFSHPGGTVHNRVGIARGIDLRGDGGCVVAPPSVHPCGTSYQWLGGLEPSRVSLAPLPDWLQHRAGTAAEHTRHALIHWRRLLREGVKEGERNNTVASITGHLLWHGVDSQVALELMLCWNLIRCRPPLDDVEVARTVRSIAHLHERHEEGD